MNVFELEEKLKRKGFKLGASCEEYIQDSGIVVTDFLFKDSALCKLVYSSLSVDIDYYAGELTCFVHNSAQIYIPATTHSVVSTINYGKLGFISKDIRYGAVEFYDNVKNVLMPCIPIEDNKFITFNTFTLSNLITYGQSKLAHKYTMNNIRFNEMDFYRLFCTLSFKENYIHFSDEFKKVLNEYYPYIDDAISSTLMSSFISRKALNEGYIWCKEYLSSQNIRWINKG